jgi:hypothetical protein
VTKPRLAEIERPAVLLVLALFVIGYFAASIRQAAALPIAADEVFVMWTLRTFAPGDFADALKGGVDSLPPGYYYLQSAITKAFGLTPLVLRASSIAAFFAFMASIFVLLRRRVPSAVAGFAAMLPLLTIAGDAATIARPYAILAACFALAVLLWLGREGGDGPLSIARAALLTLTIAFAIAMHFYAALFCIVFALMEALRSHRRGRWHARNWAAIVTAGASVFIWWPVIGPIYRNIRMSTGAPAFYATPTIDALAIMTADVLAGDEARYFLIALGCFLVLAAVIAWRRPDATSVDPIRSADFDIVALGALALPAISFVFAYFVTRSLSDRHIYTAVLGASIALAWAVRRLPGAGAACLVLMGLVVFRQANPLAAIEVGEDARIAMTRQASEPLPIVIPEAGDFFDFREQAQPPLRDRIVFMRAPAGLVSPDPEPELIATFWKRFIADLPVVSAEDFLARTPKFYVLYTSSWREGLTDWLIQHGRVRVIAHEAGLWLLEVESAR